MKYLKQIFALSALLACVGWAGSAGAADAAATAKARTERDAVCTGCHDENWRAPVLSIYQTKMGVKGDPRTPGCTNCHGASEGHLKQGPGTKPDVVFKKGPYEADDDKVRAAQCLACHKGGARNNWDGGTHQNNQIACNDCHKVHAPADPVLTKKTQTQVCFTCHKEQRADMRKLAVHPIEVGKVVCSDCHNPHGSARPKLLKRNSVNETCWQCHAEKRGPFLFEHQPVTEACTNCHIPHGSNLPFMLISRAPFLCQECHDGTHASATAVGPQAAGNQNGFVSTNPSANYTGRGCLNCHSMIHGSNSPAGGFFQR